MAKTAEELKELGNKAFGSKDYETAIKHYSDAIRLDPKNHVFFSNRSASYASLQQNEMAANDAKECIRLDPTFVKGYYRLVTALIALKEYDQAASTIKQGLAVDPENSQLTKQQRMVQQLKRSHESTMKKRQQQQQQQQDGIAMGNTGGPISSEMQELMTQFTQHKREFETEKVNATKLQREVKVAELTRQDLEPLPVDHNCYRSVGKMFLRQSKQDVMDYLGTGIATLTKKQEESQKKIQYLERKLLSQQQNIEELRKEVTANE